MSGESALGQHSGQGGVLGPSANGTNFAGSRLGGAIARAPRLLGTVVGDLTKVYSTSPNSQSESSCLFRKFPNKDLVVWKKVVLLIRQSVRNFLTSALVGWHQISNHEAHEDITREANAPNRRKVA